MKPIVQFVETTPQDLKDEITAVKVILVDFLKHNKPTQPSEYLTRQQVASLLSVNISSVHNYTKRGVLKSYGIQGRVYYKRSEVEASLKPLNF
jgi:hypothetical protein